LLLLFVSYLRLRLSRESQPDVKINKIFKSSFHDIQNYSIDLNNFDMAFGILFDSENSENGFLGD
jgi:hypothetical protein